MTSVSNFRREGDSALERVGAQVDPQTGKLNPAAVAVPAQMQASLDSFQAAHQPYAAACDEADAAHAARDAALDAIGAAAETLHARLETLAVKVIDAKAGTRMRPFAAFSTHTPSEWAKLAYAAQHAEAVKLADAVLAQVTDPAVKKAALDVKTSAEALAQKLQDLVNPQALLTGAMKARDGLLPNWHAQWREFKTQLRAAWSKEPGKIAFVLAPPPAIVSGKKKPAKKAAVVQPPTTTGMLAKAGSAPDTSESDDPGQGA